MGPFILELQEGYMQIDISSLLYKTSDGHMFQERYYSCLLFYVFHRLLLHKQITVLTVISLTMFEDYLSMTFVWDEKKKVFAEDYTVRISNTTQIKIQFPRQIGKHVS